MSLEKESTSIYAIDQSGKVWVITLASNNRLPSWTPLPNPGRVEFKRLSSVNETLWGISSAHEIYCYSHRLDIPIRVREETYENQRWNPVSSFSDTLLPTDRFPFSNEEGTENRAKELIKLPSESWVWKGDWVIENTFGSEILASDGWTYAVDFPATYHAEKNWKSCVRRRKWYRIREYIGFQRWNLCEAVHEDFTADPFTDVAVGNFGSTNQDSICVWAITVNGKVYFRKNVNSLSNPEGTHWENIEIMEGVQDASQVAVAACGTPFIVTWTGSLLYRIGITPKNLAGTDWILSNGPPGGLFQLSAGKNTLWAITRDKKCWSLKGNLQSILAKKSLEPFLWVEIPGRMKAISVSKTDMVVLAIGNDDNIVFTRFGVSSDNLHGQGWKEVFTNVSWDTVSTSSSSNVSESLDHVDGLSNPGYPTDSESGDEISIRPEIPHGCPIVDSGDHSSTSHSICWIDGACASMLKFGPETDLEVGPWREEILTGLNFRKCERNKFSYPNAIESSSSKWTKSTRTRILQHHKGAKWIKGEMEISSDTLFFYKDLHHSWMTAVQDILSVFLSRDKTSAFTLRIRNSIDPALSDFITFKFENENTMEEWRTLLIELSEKPKEEMSLANAWITTTNGEIHEAGMIKLADTPMGGAEVVTESDNAEVKLHHPLIKGFLPGSEIKVDIVIPASAVRFSLNLNGRDSNIFHFNPRMADKAVVRNSCDSKGDWGEEERDGVFPFIAGQAYAIQFSCTDTQFIVTVQSKHKFMFYYKFRFPPKFITHFTACGDVSVVGIRYDPAKAEETKHIEFVTKPVPGHFWKVESAAEGYTWAIGTDLNLWVYTGGLRPNRKSENENLVTDEQVYVIYENQRWNPLSGFSNHGLPTDRAPWSDESGRLPLDKDQIKLPSCKWQWVADWEVDYEVSGGCDKSGWQYAVDFPAHYHSSKRFNDFVRRRRWKRIGRHSTSGPWVVVPNVKMIDICIRMNEECDYEVLGVCQNGDAVVRRGITQSNPMGTHFEPLTFQKPFVNISSSYQQKIWAVGKDGFAYIRYQNNWQLLDRPSIPLKQIAVGPGGVFAVSTNNVLYRRTDIQPVFPEGKEWTKVVEGVSQVTLGTDESIWALVKHGESFHCSVAKRKGISPGNKNGIGWEIMGEGPFQYFSISGAFGRNR